MVIGDNFHIFVKSFSLDIHTHSSDMQGFSYKSSKNVATLLYAKVHVNILVTSNTEGGRIEIQERLSNFSH